MQTYLGACTELSVSDVTEQTVGQPAAILLEGYVWDIPEGPALAAEAIRIARAAGSKVALSLSDSFCVERHRDAFHNAVKNGVDIILADEDEINALLLTDNFAATEKVLAGYDNLFVMTRSEKGSVIRHGKQTVVQPASAVNKIVDSTGAGDAYTAGFLYGLTSNQSLADCARLGTFCATEVIQQVGARIEPGLLQRYSQ
jgi:sugar/nucleoside kinase (ribokinase family)